MIKIVDNIEKIKESNLVFLIEKKEDLQKLKSFNLENKIIDDITQKIEKNKTFAENYSILDGKFSKLFIYYFLDDKGKDINYFLWEEFRKLPKNLTVISNRTWTIEILINNLVLWRYKFEKYKTTKEDEDKIFLCVDSKCDKKIAEERLKTVENIVLARDLWETPSNELYPGKFAEIIEKTEFVNTKVQIFSEKELKKEGLNLLLWVWKWSKNKPYMVILERKVNKKYPTIWLVWKWITFDSGWIQVKPWDCMYEMKWDMSWAGTVFALMKELDNKDIKVNLIACIVLAENSIWDDWFRPSDIIKSYSWKTVDILHTDAEWRLALADGISYISQNYKLDKVITLATLTWACMRALWYRYAGIMWDDDDMIKKLEDYWKKNIEKYWRLPFEEYYVEKTKWKYADLENIHDKISIWATMWAAFLYNFVLNWEEFTHIDMWGTAINSYEPFWYVTTWMTGFWVDSISKIIKDL